MIGCLFGLSVFLLVNGRAPDQEIKRVLLDVAAETFLPQDDWVNCLVRATQDLMFAVVVLGRL